MRRGNISRRPASISNMNTSLDSDENQPKLHVGPTRLKPGPMLLMVAATDDNVVTRSSHSKDTIRADITNITVKATK